MRFAGAIDFRRSSLAIPFSERAMKFRVRHALAAALYIGLAGLLGTARGQEEHDARLDKKITYSAYDASLQTVADALSKETGVIIRVGSGERDWKTKERKVHAVFRDVPASTVLRELAEGLGYELRRTGEPEKWAYRIWQNTRARDYEAAMLISQTDENDKASEAVRQSLLDDANAVEKMAPEEALALKDKDPWKAYLGGTPSGRAYSQILRGLPDETKALMLRGRKVTLEASDLPPDLQDALNAMSGELLKKMITPEMGPIGDALKKMTPARIVFQPLTPEMGGGNAAATGMTGLAMIMAEPKETTPELDQVLSATQNNGIGKGMPIIGLPLTGSGSVIGQVIGKMLLDVESGIDPQTAQQEMVGRLQSARIQDQAQLNRIKPSPKPTDPALLEEIDPLTLKLDLTSGGDQSRDLVKQLSEKTPLSYLYEFYPSDTPIGMALPTKKEPLYQLLDALQLAGLTWTFDQGTVRIRPKDWAVQRSYDIPESVLASYKTALKEKGWFDLDELASVPATLTDGQIAHRFLKDPDLQYAVLGLVSFGSGNRSLLRLYGGMNPQQKAMVRSANGLPFDQLSEEQWQLLSRVVEEETGGEVRPGRLLLAVKDGPSNVEPSKEKASKAAAKPGAADQGKSAKDAKAANPSKTPAKTAEPPAPVFQTAVFTLEMQGDSPGQPLKFERNLMVPGKAQIESIRNNIKRMQEQQEKKNEEAEKGPDGKAKPADAARSKDAGPKP
jgi:hypothetical protein